MTITNIDWAEHVWNPIVGCTIASEGCVNCYAQSMAYRLERMAIMQMADTGEDSPIQHYLGLTHKAPRKGARPVWTGRMAAAPDETWLAPLRRKKPTRYFVNSMGDLFHPDVPDAWRDRAFAVMALAHWHTFIVLTKRADVMRQYLSRACGRVADQAMTLRHSDIAKRRGLGPSAIAPLPHIQPGAEWWPLPNVWIGTTAENQTEYDRRKPHLEAIPAALRFLSMEPLLSEVQMGDLSKIGWVICGGESGPDARPMHPDWARSLRDQCASAGVPFFFKQWGEWVSVSEVEGVGPHFSFADGATVRRVGKAKAGHSLDGVAHHEFP